MTAFLPSWSKLPLLLSLLLLTPRVGLAAAQDAPLASESSPAPLTSGVPGTEEQESPSLLEEPEARPTRARAPLGLRLLGEAGAGLLTSLGGAFVGVFAGYGLCEAVGARIPYIDCWWGAVAGSMVGGVVGYPLGVWWGGEALGGDGSLLATYGGMGLGLLGGLLLAAAVQPVDPSGRFTGMVFGLTSLGLPIVIYEVSQRRQPGPQEAMASARPRVQPLLSVSSRGALLGLGGTF